MPTEETRREKTESRMICFDARRRVNSTVMPQKKCGFEQYLDLRKEKG